MQHGRLARQHITANFFVIGFVAFFRPAYGGVDVYRSLQRLDRFGLVINNFNEFGTATLASAGSSSKSLLRAAYETNKP